jgi:hypothetical protein
MNLIKTTLLFLLLVMISTLMPYKRYDLSIAKQDAAESLIAADESTWNTNECFDQKMEAWFVSFNHYQSIGYDMNVADKMAVSEAENEYHSCNGDVSMQIASIE